MRNSGSYEQLYEDVIRDEAYGGGGGNLAKKVYYNAVRSQEFDEDGGLRSDVLEEKDQFFYHKGEGSALQCRD